MDTIFLNKCYDHKRLQDQLDGYLGIHHCLLIAKRGHGTLLEGETYISFSEKEMVYIPVATAIECPELTGSCYSIFFLPLLYCSSVLAGNKKSGRAVEKFMLAGKEYSVIMSLLSLTIKSFMTSPARKLEMFLFLCNFILERKMTFANRKDHLFRQFAELASECCHKEHKVKYYADALFITKGYLEKIVKTKSGKTPKEFLLEQLSNKAIVLLCDTSHTVETISEQLGFKEASAFSTLFKNGQDTALRLFGNI